MFVVDEEKRSTWNHGWWRSWGQGKVLIALAIIGGVSFLVMLPHHIAASPSILLSAILLIAMVPSLGFSRMQWPSSHRLPLWAAAFPFTTIDPSLLGRSLPRRG